MLSRVRDELTPPLFDSPRLHHIPLQRRSKLSAFFLAQNPNRVIGTCLPPGRVNVALEEF